MHSCRLTLHHSDQHTVGRHIVSDELGQPAVRNEGFFRAHIGSGRRCSESSKCSKMRGTFAFYDVPFGVMVPANAKQAANLIVPVCISASSVAYSSTRIENMFMDLGSAAGVAVAGLLDLETNHETGFCPTLKVQDVNVSSVQHVLSEVYKQKFHGVDSPHSSEKI